MMRKMNKELAEKSIAELAIRIENKEISPVDVMQATFAQIEAKNPYLCAYVDTFDTEAKALAIHAEKEILQGNYRGKLHGIPIGVKDNLYMKGKNIRVGSKIHQDFIPSYDATVIRKLRDQGAIFTGLLNMHEYAYGFTTTNPYYGTCRNPWDLERIPGGSSGGSAAAVAADMTIAALGSETGGSLRAPASFNGIVSIKPTYGRVSKHGCFPFAWSLDHVGPMTKTVEDAAILLQAMAGHDPLDTTTASLPVPDYSSYLHKDVADMVIGINEEYLFANADEQVEKSVRHVINELEKLGAKIVPVQFKTFENALFAFMMTMAAEATALHHENLVKRPEDYGIEVRTELMFGELISAVDYLQAQQIRRTIRDEFEEVFQEVDVIVGPTLPFTAGYIGTDTVMLNGEEVKLPEHVSRFIRPTTLTGIPAMSVPCGLVNGLPVGIQILAGPFMEKKIFQVASTIEALQLMRGLKPTFNSSLTE